VGEAIHSEGIYETDLEADGSVIFLRPSPPPALYSKTAGDIAAKAVWCATCVPSFLGQFWRIVSASRAVRQALSGVSASFTHGQWDQLVCSG